MPSLQKSSEHIPVDCILRVVEHNFTFSPEHWEHFRTCDFCVDNFAEFLRVLRQKRRDFEAQSSSDGPMQEDVATEFSLRQPVRAR